MVKSVMDIYDSRYFVINKNLLIVLGLWPYDNRKKYFIRTFHLILLFILSIPQFISIQVHHSNFERLMENIYFATTNSMVFVKLLSLGLAEKQLKIIFDRIAETWQTVVDESEIQILREYSERGRTLTLINLIFYFMNFIFFIPAPLIPVILNMLNPQMEPLPYIYVMNGEFLLKDRDAYYYNIYLWDTLNIFMIVYIVATTAAVYTACIYHYLGLLMIIRHRIKRHGLVINGSSLNSTDSDYEQIVKTVEFHQQILQLRFVKRFGTKALQASYSIYCLYMLSISVIMIPITCNLLLFDINDLVRIIHFSVTFSGSSFILFNLCWPGQQLSDYSTNLFQDAYCNEWYKSSARSNKILTLFMLRCLTACEISAGGLFTMNFETFFSVMKTAVSYVTVLASLR